MINHLFKMAWNRRGKNLLIILEIFLCFIVLFWVGSIATYSIQNYSTPLGYNYENVYFLGTDYKGVSEEKANQSLSQLKLMIQGIPEVEKVVSSASIPFLSWSTTERVESEHMAGNALKWNVKDDFKEVLEIQMIDGRWFSQQDVNVFKKPIVITKDFEEKYFLNTSGLGKKITSDSTEYIVIGICENTRSDVFSVSQPGFYSRINPEDIYSSFLIKVKSSNHNYFEENVIKKSMTLTNRLEGNWEVDGAFLDKVYFGQMYNYYLQFGIIGVVCGFLIVNVIMGLVGVFWLNIGRRTVEIGLRRAVGAFSSKIYSQILLETIIVATFGILPGILLAIQFPLLDVLAGVSTSTYVISIGFATFTTYLLVILCAYFPSRKAAQIEPALALYET